MQVIKYLKQAADAGGFSTMWAITATPSTTQPTLLTELQMPSTSQKPI